MITITKDRIGSNWVSGKTSEGFVFQAKVFDEPSKWGMSTPTFEDGNNVSILSITEAATGDEVYFFDRGREEQDFARIDHEELCEIVMFLEGYTED